MKLCNFISGDKTHVGALCGDKIIDLTSAGLKEDINGLIRGGGASLERVKSLCESGEAAALPEAEARYDCVTKPGKLICVGLNYKSHAEETGGKAPEYPLLFSKFGDALCPSGKDVFLPPWQHCYDYEAELVIVIGKPAWNVPVTDAGDYIFGYTCGNDLSARDCQFISSQWLIGKTFPDFAPAGPYIVTADSFDPDAGSAVICELNGSTVQSGNTNDMIFNCRQIVSYASRYFRLSPGDLIFTGTPAGVILGHEKGNRVWLKAGDTVRVTIEGIGTLENRLI